MTRRKLLIENILVYGFGNIINKIVPLLMLPIVTRLLPDPKYYGLNDILNVIVSFSTAIVVMGMYDIMFRMFFEEETYDYKKRVCSSSLLPVLVCGLIVLSLLLVFRNFFSLLFFDSKDLIILVVIAAGSMYLSSVRSIISAPTRMQNKKVTLIVINVVLAVFSYSISILMLLKGFYLLALPCGFLVSSLLAVIIFGRLNYKWFNIKSIDFTLMKQMLKLGLPLVPVFLFFWIFSSFDRLMISNMLGSKYVGVYGVGAKVASISQLIYAAFAAGWQYFAFSTMKDKDQVNLISKVYEYIGVISFASVVLLLPFVKNIFELLFTGDYIKGEIVFPYLFLSPLILLLYQIGVSQFIIIKKTYITSVILLLGVILNVSFNFLLIPALGIEGAAISTLFGYVVSATVATIILVKLKLLNISIRFVSSACLLLGTIIFIRLTGHDWMNVLICFAVVLVYMFLFRSELGKVWNFIRKYIYGV